MCWLVERLPSNDRRVYGEDAAVVADHFSQRKEACAKKNAELSDPKKNGYQPGGDQLNYPQKLQNAETKSAAAKAKAVSAQ